MCRVALLFSLSVAVFASAPAFAADVSVAVAANFTKPAEELGAAFTARTGDTVTFSFGATGGLYTQITQGAPFEIFLAADTKRPAQAVADGFAVEASVFTYATGKVVLYGPSLDLTDGEAMLRAGDFDHIAIADPETAPYGTAALEAIAALELADALTPKLVIGQNISQTQQFVDSGSAELGFVALSQVIEKPAPQTWLIPAELYTPIAQDAVLLKTGAANPAAAAFLDFLRSSDGKAIIAKYGYETE